MTAKVSTICAVPYYETAEKNNTGAVSAYVMTEAVGFHGTKVFRRVRIGLEFGVTPEKAKNMMQNLRESNDTLNITGRFVMEI